MPPAISSIARWLRLRLTEDGRCAMSTSVHDWRLALSLCTLFLPCTSSAQHPPLSRHFVAGVEERYHASLQIKAESHSVTTETIDAKTYVTPRVATAGIRLAWNIFRKIALVQSDGSALIEEHSTPAGTPCQLTDPMVDPALQKSLTEFCAGMSKESTLHYMESPRGAVKESEAAVVPALGESGPPLLALWLRRAVHPSVILPAMPFEVGASTQYSLQPENSAMKNAHGSETTEWLDALGETPAAMLHVVQQLAWKSSAGAAALEATKAPVSRPPRAETFFADSLTTLSLLDGAVLRASRTATRTEAHEVDPVPGLPARPDFSSKLTITVTLERVP